jgi:hypothetical protein
LEDYTMAALVEEIADPTDIANIANEGRSVRHTPGMFGVAR